MPVMGAAILTKCCLNAPIKGMIITAGDITRSKAFLINGAVHMTGKYWVNYVDSHSLLNLNFVYVYGKYNAQ